MCLVQRSFPHCFLQQFMCYSIICLCIISFDSLFDLCITYSFAISFNNQCVLHMSCSYVVSYDKTRVAPSKLLSKFILFLCSFYFCVCSPFFNCCVVLIVYVFKFIFICFVFSSIQHFYRFSFVCDHVNVFGICCFYSFLYYLFDFEVLIFFLLLFQVNSQSFNEFNMKPLKKKLIDAFLLSVTTNTLIIIVVL